jgi:integrase
MGKLTAAKIAALTEPGRYGDGHNLWLQVSQWGTKAWVLRYWRDGRERNFGLGPLELVPLADARKRALKVRRELLDGIDPIDARKAARTARRLEHARSKTFGQAAQSYIQAHSASWRSPKHRQQWLQIESQCKAIWTLPVQNIGTDEVLHVLNPMWTTKTITATRVRARIESVLAHAAARGWRPSTDNPARWAGHLQSMLPAPTKIAKVIHHAALPVDDAPSFAAELRAKGGIAAAALEIALLTALRSGEVIGARWSELDLSDKVWSLPGPRMKTGRPHRVPLSPRAVEIFKSIRPLAGSDLVFEGIKRGDNPGSMLALMRELRPDFTVHGLRSTFRDYAGERTNFPRDIVEEALAHAVGDATERAYRRSDLLAKRRKLMDQWASYCTSPKAAGNVVELQRA